MALSINTVCIFLILSSLSAVVRSLQLLSQSSGIYADAESAVRHVVSGPVRGNELLLVVDELSQQLLNMGQVMAAAGASLTPALITTQTSLLKTQHPKRHTKAPKSTAIILFHADPTPFLILLNKNIDWNPRYLILVSLDPTLNLTLILSMPVVQRSLYVLAFHPAEKSSNLRLHAFTSLPFLQTSQGQSLTKAPMGIWSPEKFPTHQSLFPPRFQDFGGKVMEVSMVCYEEPFLYFDRNRDCIGSNLDALQMIGDKLNFKFTLTSPVDVVWGSKENGTWNGMLGQLMYEGKDISVNVLQPSPDRASEFDYTYPYWEDGFAIMISMPPPMPQWRNILYPFSRLMWGLLAAITLGTSSTLAFILWRLNGLKDPIAMMLKIMGGLVNQPMDDIEVRMWWSRLWLIFWWVAVDILAAAYMSNLVAVLSVPVYPERINTVYDLAHSDYIPSMGDYGDFAPQALKISKNPTLALLGRKLYLQPIYDPDNFYGPLIKKVLAGTHAMMVTVDYLIYTHHNKNLTHTTYIMNERIFSSYMSWFLPRNTPYTDILSSQVLQLLETGILHKLYEMHIGGLIGGKEEKVRGSGVLNLNHLQGAFIVLGFGMLTAFIILMFEKLVSSRNHNPLQ